MHSSPSRAPIAAVLLLTSLVSWSAPAFALRTLGLEESNQRRPLAEKLLQAGLEEKRFASFARMEEEYRKHFRLSGSMREPGDKLFHLWAMMDAVLEPLHPPVSPWVAKEDPTHLKAAKFLEAVVGNQNQEALLAAVYRAHYASVGKIVGVQGTHPVTEKWLMQQNPAVWVDPFGTPMDPADVATMARQEVMKGVSREIAYVLFVSAAAPDKTKTSLEVGIVFETAPSYIRRAIAGWAVLGHKKWAEHLIALNAKTRHDSEAGRQIFIVKRDAAEAVRKQENALRQPAATPQPSQPASAVVPTSAAVSAPVNWRVMHVSNPFSSTQNLGSYVRDLDSFLTFLKGRAQKEAAVKKLLAQEERSPEGYSELVRSLADQISQSPDALGTFRKEDLVEFALSRLLNPNEEDKRDKKAALNALAEDLWKSLHPESDGETPTVSRETAQSPAAAAGKPAPFIVQRPPYPSSRPPLASAQSTPSGTLEQLRKELREAPEYGQWPDKEEDKLKKLWMVLYRLSNRRGRWSEEIILQFLRDSFGFKNERAKDEFSRADKLTPDYPFVTEQDVRTLIAEVLGAKIQSPPDIPLVQLIQKVLKRVDVGESAQRPDGTDTVLSQAIQLIAAEMAAGKLYQPIQKDVFDAFGRTAGLEEGDEFDFEKLAKEVPAPHEEETVLEYLQRLVPMYRALAGFNGEEKVMVIVSGEDPTQGSWRQSEVFEASLQEEQAASRVERFAQRAAEHLIQGGTAKDQFVSFVVKTEGAKRIVELHAKNPDEGSAAGLEEGLKEILLIGEDLVRIDAVRTAIGGVRPKLTVVSYLADGVSSFRDFLKNHKELNAAIVVGDPSILREGSKMEPIVGQARMSGIRIVVTTQLQLSRGEVRSLLNRLQEMLPSGGDQAGLEETRQEPVWALRKIRGMVERKEVDPIDEADVMAQLEQVAALSLSGMVEIHRVGAQGLDLRIQPAVFWFDKKAEEVHRRILQLVEGKDAKALPELLGIIGSPEILDDARVAAARALTRIPLADASSVLEALDAVDRLIAHNDNPPAPPAHLALYDPGSSISERRFRFRRQLSAVRTVLVALLKQVPQEEELSLEKLYPRLKPLLTQPTAQILATNVMGVMTGPDGVLPEIAAPMYDRFLSWNPAAQLVLLSSLEPGQVERQVTRRLGYSAQRRTTSLQVEQNSSKGLVLARWAAGQREDPAAILFMDDRPEAFKGFPADWPGTLVYLGPFNPTLPANVIQIFRPGERRPANGLQIAQAVVLLELAKRRFQGSDTLRAARSMAHQEQTIGRPPVEFLLDRARFIGPAAEAWSPLKTGLEEGPVAEFIHRYNEILPVAGNPASRKQKIQELVAVAQPVPLTKEQIRVDKKTGYVYLSLPSPLETVDGVRSTPVLYDTVTGELYVYTKWGSASGLKPVFLDQRYLLTVGSELHKALESGTIVLLVPQTKIAVPAGLEEGKPLDETLRADQFNPPDAAARRPAPQSFDNPAEALEALPLAVHLTPAQIQKARWAEAQRFSGLKRGGLVIFLGGQVTVDAVEINVQEGDQGTHVRRILDWGTLKAPISREVMFDAEFFTIAKDTFTGRAYIYIPPAAGLEEKVEVQEPPVEFSEETLFGWAQPWVKQLASLQAKPISGLTVQDGSRFSSVVRDSLSRLLNPGDQALEIPRILLREANPSSAITLWVHEGLLLPEAFLKEAAGHGVTIRSLPLEFDRARAELQAAAQGSLFILDGQKVIGQNRRLWLQELSNQGLFSLWVSSRASFQGLTPDDLPTLLAILRASGGSLFAVDVRSDSESLLVFKRSV